MSVVESSNGSSDAERIFPKILALLWWRDFLSLLSQAFKLLHSDSSLHNKDNLPPGTKPTKRLPASIKKN